MSARLDLQTKALKGELPLYPIGLRGIVAAHGWGYSQDSIHQGPYHEIETAYEGRDVGPLLAVGIRFALTDCFFSVHRLEVGGAVLIDDRAGIHATLLDIGKSNFQRTEPAVLRYGEKILLGVRNLDAAQHLCCGAMYFVRDST